MTRDSNKKIINTNKGNMLVMKISKWKYNIGIKLKLETKIVMKWD